VEEFVADSFLEKAPIVPVSVTQGEGLELLKAELIRAANRAVEMDSSRRLRLPIDRVFSMKGFGTVVTVR
jgi:selenocysteine-specific elongation factor